MHAPTLPVCRCRVVFNGAPRYPSSKEADGGPGPGAYTLDGKSWSKTRCSAIKGREKFGSAGLTSAVDVPGPGEYPRLETRQTTVRNTPSYSIRSRAIAKPPAFAVPAPNAHQKVEAADKFEFVAKYNNAPRVAFGKPPKSRVLSEEAAAVFASPGPSEYSIESGFAHLSTLKSIPAFSLVPRRPPPGARAGGRIEPDFHAPIQGCGKQALSHKKTAPSVTLSGRVKFGSPYFM